MTQMIQSQTGNRLLVAGNLSRRAVDSWGCEQENPACSSLSE